MPRPRPVASAQHGKVLDKPFVVHKIVSHRVEKDANGHFVTKFRVRWKDFGQDDDTWEPLENISTVPRLLLAYTKIKVRAHAKSSRSQSGAPPRIRPPPPDVVAYWRSFEPDYYVPSGAEFLKKIYVQFPVRGEEFVTVSFKKPYPKMVHAPRCLIDYFFPTECALFLLQRAQPSEGEKNAKTK